MINWIEKESRECCRVNYCDADPFVGVDIVLATYFGGEDGSYDMVYSIEDFFENHEPERMHS